MKKRLISLLVALCMAVTLLPVSAITAWAEESSSNSTTLRIKNGYPVGSIDANGTHTTSCSGDGWSYDGSTQTLTLDPSTPTTYDLKDYGSIRQDYNSIACSTIIEKNATIVNGSFLDIKNPGSSITNYGTITSGTYSMPVINHGTITGGIFRKKPTGGNVDNGYTLNVNSQQNGSYESFYAEIKDLGSSVYVIPNSYYNTSVTILYGFFDSWPETLFPIDVTFGNTNDTHCLLKDWAPSARYHYNADHVYVTFTAPPANAGTVTLSKLTRLVIDENGYPVGTEGGTRDYSGNGWKFEKGNSTLTLTSGSYDFSALRSLSSDVHLVVDGATIVNPEPKPDPKPEPKPDPKPEPEPDPTPETSTYTLTVKGGTFTYNGGEAMTSANVPVDAEVKVTLNQSAVPEGMVFDLWAMDGASLLGNPAVAYNEESFTIPAGSVAKGSTVTVEAQYRDATIESEPSILGTAAIIGVAGAGTAVIVWQGYRIGMELYEKYFQPTPEETAAEQPAPEAPAAAAAS